MSTTSSKRVQFGTPDRGKGASSRASSGRRCEVPGCTTVLSTYNFSPTCWLHSAPSHRHPLSRH
jgi:hypothetical protein